MTGQWPPRNNWNNVESGVKNHSPNPSPNLDQAKHIWQEISPDDKKHNVFVTSYKKATK